MASPAFPDGMSDMPQGTVRATRDYCDPRLQPPLVYPPGFRVPDWAPDCHVLGNHTINPDSHVRPFRLIHVGGMSDEILIQQGSIVFGRHNGQWWYHTGVNDPGWWDPVPPTWFSCLYGYYHAGWWQPKPELAEYMIDDDMDHDR